MRGLKVFLVMLPERCIMQCELTKTVDRLNSRKSFCNLFPCPVFWYRCVMYPQDRINVK